MLLDEPLDSIDALLSRIDRVVEASRRAASRIGYFAALYRLTTNAIAQGMSEGRFDDGPRMERFALNFAGRYFGALERFRRNENPGRAWSVAFKAGETCMPTVLQHLALGMNAHINFDLGPAAFATAAGQALDSLRADFDRVNAFMAAGVDEMQRRLAGVAPALGLLDVLGGPVDESIANLSLREARDRAWHVADTLNRLPAADHARVLENLDEEVEDIGRAILSPGLLRPALCALRIGEPRNVTRVIDILSAT